MSAAPVDNDDMPGAALAQSPIARRSEARQALPAHRLVGWMLDRWAIRQSRRILELTRESRAPSHPDYRRLCALMRASRGGGL